MSLERLVAGCLLPGFVGTRVPDWVLRRVAGGLGGVVLFARNVSPALPELCASLGEVLIALDEEGGDVTRLEAERGSSYPGNLALGVVDDVALTERVAAAIGSDLRAAGVNVNLAPVADANTNPDNPIVGVRAFGADPELVARHVAAFVRGTQASPRVPSTSRGTATRAATRTSSCRSSRETSRRRSCRSAPRSPRTCAA